MFRYKDEMSDGQWRVQECTVESVERCIEIYGLETDPTVYDFEIIAVEDI